MRSEMRPRFSFACAYLLCAVALASPLASAAKGASENIVHGDFDGDGKADVAVLEFKDGGGYIIAIHEADGDDHIKLVSDSGAEGDVHISIAAPEDYPATEGIDGLATLFPSSQVTVIDYYSPPYAAYVEFYIGRSTIQGDFDGDGKIDTATLEFKDPADGYIITIREGNGDEPLVHDSDKSGKGAMYITEAQRGTYPPPCERGLGDECRDGNHKDMPLHLTRDAIEVVFPESSAYILYEKDGTYHVFPTSD